MKRIMHRTLLAAALLVAWWTRPADADRQIEHRFAWDQGNVLVSTAQTPADFQRAADAYRRLIASGVRNGPLFYNYGTALMKAERYDDALGALLRAERYVGTNEDIRRNLRIARASGDEDEQTGLPWHRIPLFWHYGLAGTTRLTIALVAFSMVWLALAARVVGWAGLSRHVLVLSLIVLALFGSSVAVSFHGESRDSAGILAAENPDEVVF